MAKYKKRKDGRYAANILIGYAPDGRKKYAPTVYARSIVELENKKAEVKEALRRGTYANDKHYTVGQYAQEWIITYKSHMQASTYKNYKYALHKLRPIFDIRLKDLTKSDVQGLLNSLSDRPGAAKMARLTIKQILNAAADDHLIYHNVASTVTIVKPRKSDKRALTPGEKAAISSACLTDAEKAFVYMLYYTGVRRGEALALTRNDIDFANHIISINKSLTWAGGGVHVKVPKTSSSTRVLPMNPSLEALLAKYLETHEDAVVFPAARGGYMTLNIYIKFWNDLRDKLGSKYLTAHVFRHNFATLLYYAGVDAKKAQQLLGHSSIVITLDIYTHLDKLRGDFDMRESISRIEGL